MGSGGPVRPGPAARGLCLDVQLRHSGGVRQVSNDAGWALQGSSGAFCSSECLQREAKGFRMLLQAGDAAYLSPLQGAELCPPLVWSWTAGAPVPRLGPRSPTGPRAAGWDPERRLAQLPAALRTRLGRHGFLRRLPFGSKRSRIRPSSLSKTHLLEQKPVMLCYFRFTK